MTPLFITLEGIEGSGKTTQIEKLGNWFEAQGKSVVKTREPGGTEIGQTLRKMILSAEEPLASPYTEVLLFYADRLEHVARKIQPALNEGKVVICDRFSDSTLAYQIGGRNIPTELIDRLNEWVPVQPTFTFLLDLDPEEGLRRVKKRSGVLDRFEQEEIAFHHRVRQAYLDQAKKEPRRIHVISVQDKDPEAVFEAIIAHVQSLLGI